MKYKFTIFTPTYNRAYCIEKVYQSLLKQTISDFEWVVIDDGSSDGTRELISSFANEGKIDIVYYYQKNQGKHVAQNYAVSIARGELFLPLDSDDIIVPNNGSYNQGGSDRSGTTRISRLHPEKLRRTGREVLE